MGFFGDIGKGVLNSGAAIGGSIANGLTGDFMGLLTGGLGKLFGGGEMSQEEMLEKQYEYQSKLMGLQAQQNRELAQFNQGLAKEMWEYTNYENQIKHMKAAGLNPALLYGKGGGGGASASGAGAAGAATIPSAPTMFMGLQLEQMKANIAKTKAETAATYAASGSKTGVENTKTEEETEKVKQETENLKKQGKILLENLTGVREDNKLKEFQNWINEAKRRTKTNDKTFAEELASTEIREILARENIAYRDWRKAAIDDDFNARLSNFMETLVNGEVAKATEQIEIAKQAKNDTEFQKWTQRQETALSEALDELLDGAGKYEKILVGIAKWIFRSDSGAWKSKGGKK